ncbi:dienelactone hydrolase family protein [Arthrobacter zhaoguopingii]|uniref:dienelactone hydrolase family protein n=1 Tax=Arthrobacter zhaoguopingii TaxID=2681491 RepID=UPI0031B88B37
MPGGKTPAYSGGSFGLPVQVYAMEQDPFFAGEGDLDAARALASEVVDAGLFLYPGREHLFADSSLPSYDAGATALLTCRVLGFLDGTWAAGTLVNRDGGTRPAAGGTDVLNSGRADVGRASRGCTQHGHSFLAHPMMRHRGESGTPGSPPRPARP